jgi:hypothetical protein
VDGVGVLTVWSSEAVWTKRVKSSKCQGMTVD